MLCKLPAHAGRKGRVGSLDSPELEAASFIFMCGQTNGTSLSKATSTLPLRPHLGCSYLGASSLAFAAYSSAFPVALVAQAAGAPLRYQKLHPPCECPHGAPPGADAMSQSPRCSSAQQLPHSCGSTCARACARGGTACALQPLHPYTGLVHPCAVTGWIKYTGPAGADALLLAAGQEPDGWSTQVTGRSALDGAQSRHRMLRRVRLVRGPAVVTVLAQETRPGEWQLRGARAGRRAGWRAEPARRECVMRSWLLRQSCRQCIQAWSSGCVPCTP